MMRLKVAILVFIVVAGLVTESSVAEELPHSAGSWCLLATGPNYQDRGLLITC